MKIQDALKQNKDYWIEREKQLATRLANMQNEVQKIAKEFTEAQEQIGFYIKAEEILVTLNPIKVDEVKVVEEVSASTKAEL